MSSHSSPAGHHRAHAPAASDVRVAIVTASDSRTADTNEGGKTLRRLLEAAGFIVVADAILAEADRDPLDWRDRQMVHGDRDDIERIALTGAPGGPVVLVHSPQGFRIDKPISDRADRELADGLLADLTGLMAERFVAAGKSPAELGLSAPRETVEVTFKGQPPLRIELGAPVTRAAAPEGQTNGELTYARIGDTLF